jgi:Metal binding domain of Ada.
MMKTDDAIRVVRNTDARYRDKFFIAVRASKIVCTPLLSGESSGKEHRVL